MSMVATESQIDEIGNGHCGTKFTPKRKCKWQRFCSSACRFAHWNEKNPRQRIVAEQLQRIEVARCVATTLGVAVPIVVGTTDEVTRVVRVNGNGGFVLSAAGRRDNDVRSSEGRRSGRDGRRRRVNRGVDSGGKVEGRLR